MRAMVIRRYGGPEVLEPAEVDDPVPGPGEVLVRARATSVNYVECAMRRGALKLFLPLKLPAVLGVDVAGEVLALGPGAQGFAAGERVYAFLTEKRNGGYGERVAVPASSLGRVPKGLSWAEAATIPGAGMTALLALHDEARVQPGQKVLVIGGAGGVGTFAIQIAKALGAEVTAVCSTSKVALAQKLGAAHVIDYKREELLDTPERFDVIIDTAPAGRTFLSLRKLLVRGGIHLAIVPAPLQQLASRLSWLVPGKRSTVYLLEPGRGYDVMARLVEAGQVKPVVHRVYPLAKLADAHREFESGAASGKIAVEIGEA